MNNPRIISGEYKNQTLEVPSSARPITDRVKQVLFDTLQEVIKGAVLADLFAGSGNIGIEALSRGAAHVTFVETDEQAVEVIKRNLEKLKIKNEKLKIAQQSYNSFCDSSEAKFDLIFLDPPFEMVLRTDLSKLKNILAKEGYAVIKVATEDVKRLKTPETFERVLEKTVGSNTLVFLRNSS